MFEGWDEKVSAFFLSWALRPRKWQNPTIERHIFSFRMVLSWLRKLRNVAVLFMVTITLLVAWPAYAASDVSRAHDRPLRLAIVNTYGQILSNIYYGESLKKIRAAIAPRPLEIRIYGPDTFLDAARNDQFDMSDSFLWFDKYHVASNRRGTRPYRR